MPMPSPRCPHCGAAAPRDPAASASPPAAIVCCARCGRSYPRGPTSQAARAGTTARAIDDARHPCDVGNAVPAALGALATVSFYLAVVPVLGDRYIGQLFAERGWVPYAISLFAFWSLAVLALKLRNLTRQRRDLTLDLVPDEIAALIDRESAPAFAAHLEHVQDARRDGLLVDRVARALDLVRGGRRPQEVLDQLALRAQGDLDAVESSYTLVRVFVWAIPILGFIGTVLGIGAAVSGFSDSVAAAVDLDVMKHSIGTVTTGLGIAFDTTLLALVMSIGIMLPTSVLQKAEEDWLARVDAHVGARIARRLDWQIEGPQGDAAPSLPVVLARLDHSLERLEARLGAASS